MANKPIKLATHSLTIFGMIFFMLGCNMPTHPSNLVPINSSMESHKHLNCQELELINFELLSDEADLEKSQKTRITDSHGHNIFYGWGKGNGMDTVELVKTRSKIESVRIEMSKKNCISLQGIDKR